MRKWFLLLVVAVVFLGFAGWWFGGRHPQLPPVTPVFDGPSTALRQTTIVPTLDSPMPKGRNVIWCASFLLAWRQAQDKVIHAPLQVKGAEAVARRLNSAPVKDIKLDPGDCYTNAGRLEDGIIAEIRKDMAAKFSEVPEAWLPAEQSGIGINAYAYLRARVRFDIPFPDIPEGQTFIDSRRQGTKVHAFGITSKYECILEELRKQVEVLFYERKEFVEYQVKGKPEQWLHADEFAVDLCRTSRPYQMVLACMPHKATLADTIADVQRRIDAEPQDPERQGAMAPDDTLIVPEMCWRISHHFSELEGKPLLNAGGDPIVEAVQHLDFTLDRSGVKLASASNMRVLSIPKSLVCTRPFLLYLTRRGSDTPFFAMWVDNAELLDKVEGGE